MATATKTRSSNNGGSRPGSGRKFTPEARRTVCLSLAVEIREYLDAFENMSGVVESIIRSSPAYKAWEVRRPKGAIVSPPPKGGPMPLAAIKSAAESVPIARAKSAAGPILKKGGKTSARK